MSRGSIAGARRALHAALLALCALLAMSATARADWVSSTGPFGTDLRSVSCSSSTRCVAAATDGRFIVTTDAGANWTAYGSTADPDLWGISCPSTTVCYAAGTAGEIRKSTDGGVSWTTFGSTGDPRPPRDLLSVDHHLLRRRTRR